MSSVVRGDPPASRTGLKWFCAVSASTLDFYNGYNMRDLLRVAIFSAIVNTTLRPNVLYDGPPDVFTDELETLGAKVIFHRSILYDALAAHYVDDWMRREVLAGTFLRFDIPAIEQDEEFALFTDVDVIFLRNPAFGREIPTTFGATSESSRNPKEDMNAGVMLLNLNHMRQVLPHLNDFTRKSLHIGHDQDILRAFFGKNYTPLDLTLNWKPYWGFNLNAQILHFHGPKPGAVRDALTGVRSMDNETWAQLLGRDPASYESYTRLWYIYYESFRSRYA